MSTGRSKINVSYVSELARLKLSPEEQARLSGQLTHILEYVDQLSKLNIDGIEPTAHATPLVNVFRKDESRPGFSAQTALKNAPQKMNNLFVVPRVVED